MVRQTRVFHAKLCRPSARIERASATIAGFLSAPRTEMTEGQLPPHSEEVLGTVEGSPPSREPLRCEDSRSSC